MAIYLTPNDKVQVYVDNRLQGWQVQVSFWTGEEFDVRYDSYVIADSLYEAVTGALTASGMGWEEADWHCAEWEIISDLSIELKAIEAAEKAGY